MVDAICFALLVLACLGLAIVTVMGGILVWSAVQSGAWPVAAFFAACVVLSWVYVLLESKEGK